MGILKDRSQLEFYIDAVERWAAIAAYTGTPKEIQAELILTIAFKQNPELCKEMSDHFGSKLRKNKDGIKELVKWLKSKFGLNKHADMVKILNTFLNTCRAKTELLTDFITRFEKNYGEVKKMGEKLSETCLAILLLRQANLSDTDSQIITINLEFDPKATDAKNQFEAAKAAIRKFQHTRSANHQAYGHTHNHQQPQSNHMKTFLTSLEQEDQMDPEQLESIQTFITSVKTRGRGGGETGRGGGRGRDRRGGRGGGRVWKCEYCLCSHPLWEQCKCPCTTHARESCPNPDATKKEAYRKRKAEIESNKQRKRQETEHSGTTTSGTSRTYITHSSGFTERLAEVETDYEATLLCKVVEETESESFRPLEELFEALGVQESGDYSRPVTHPHAAPGPGAGPKVQTVPQTINADRAPLQQGPELVYLRTDSNQRWQDTITVSSEVHKLFFLIDCGSPSTIVGVEDFKVMKRQYTEMIQSTFDYRPSNKKYEFGGGEKTHSMGRVRLPIYVLDENKIPHIIHVWVEVLNQKNLPLLLGGKSLTKAGGTLCFKTLTLSLDWKEKRLCLPIKVSNSGHYHLQFFPMSEQEDQLLIREMVDMADWTNNEVKNILTYLATENNPDITKIKAPERINSRRSNKPLTKKQIIQVHQSLGHAHRDKIRNMVKATKLYDDNTLRFIDELADCEVCAVEHNRVPRPRVAMPRSKNSLAIPVKWI